MFNIKHIINSTNNVDNNENSWLRGTFMLAILEVLSNKSRDGKQNMIELKKRIYWTLDMDFSKIEDMDLFKDFATWFEQLLSSDKEANWITASLSAIKWIKDTWLWKNKEFDEELDEITKESRDKFVALANRFVKYADSFSNNYEKAWTDYILKNKNLPNYKYLLKKVFCNYLERYIKQSVKNLKFSEEDCKEWFGSIQEWLEDRWLNLEPSDNIKQSFIKLCRERYPLASKKNDFLFENKSFRQNFIKDITDWLDKYLEDTFENMVKDCINNVDKDMENFEPNENISYEKQRTLLLSTNIVIGTISLINWLIDEWSWEDNAIGLYFKYIADQFEYDHLKKLGKRAVKDAHIENKTKFSNNEIFVTDSIKTWWEVNLSERDNNLIKEAVSYINCEKKKSIIRYITKLKMKDLPIKFHDFKRLFNLKEIPPKTESILIDQLWMDYEVEEEGLKAENEISKEIANKNNDKIKNKVFIPEKIVIENPTKYLIDKLESVWCIFDNKLTAKKQIDEFCQNDNYRTVLINLMTSPKFWKVFLHKPGHKTARTLRIGMTGWRILFTKKKDGNLHFVCFGNHDYYEDCLAKLK